MQAPGGVCDGQVIGFPGRCCLVLPHRLGSSQYKTKGLPVESRNEVPSDILEFVFLVKCLGVMGLPMQCRLLDGAVNQMAKEKTSPCSSVIYLT